MDTKPDAVYEALKNELNDQRLKQIEGYFKLDTEAKKELLKNVLEVTFLGGWNAGANRALDLQKELQCTTQ